ncbi:MAG: DegT/DnrJ/EryC1/StrS family aminotransferase [Kiritimatiellae bacterium]|nr:DegT/DnrJ/EryC1/StrS family aminotransferase [Verrucomicrobiota bacterium]MCG2680945.1 DegT/DnrJ/EryC1/StrS family aminotransferase [Kiritimatiellia bacterium]
MKNDKLAIYGGEPAYGGTLHAYNSIGAEEIDAVARVMRSGCLSGYYGSWSNEFFGGPVVQAFEAAWVRRFNCRHAVAVNSNTSGLIAAMGAVGVSPGDEVIVPPMTMAATAMAPLIYGGIPVFVDMDPVTYCLAPDLVRKSITPKTRAILVVNLFGHIAHLEELRAIADEHGVFLIEDNAQAPLGTENGRYAGTIGHIGVFSLNYHKHIHTGEGGVCTTDNDDLALRMQLLRNHAESCVEGAGMANLVNMVGFNMRMTELCAAVGLEQLKKIDYHVGMREHIAQRLNEGLAGLVGITPPVQRDSTRPVYYMYQIRFDRDAVGVSREIFAKALAAEGFPTFLGYLKPLYMLPVFQKRVAIGREGWPFTLTERVYRKGLCPVAERLHEKELVGFDNCCLKITDFDLDGLIAAFRKVHAGRGQLKQVEEGHT